MSPEEALVDWAQLLTLTAPEMTVLVVACASWAQMPGSHDGVLTKRPETLTNDFVNPFDMSTQWQPGSAAEGVYEAAIARRTRPGGPAPESTDFRFAFELRALAEVYACADSKRNS